MKILKLVLYLLTISFVFYSCNDEDKDVDPSVKTVAVTATSASTVLARGNIEEIGSYNVVDYGFEYSTDGTTQKISLGNKPNKGTFESEISASSSYYNYGINVKAYLINDKGTVYGENIQTTFPTLAITSIAPLAGKAGDRITIMGTNFSTKTQDNKVSFNETIANVVEASSSKLVVEVPNNINNSSYYYYGVRVTVKVGNQSIVATEYFKLTPTVTDFSPKSGTVGTLVTLNGNNFSGASFSILVGGISVSTAGVTNNNVTFYIPSGVKQEKLKIDFVFNGITTSLPGEFSLLAPEITNYSPKTGIGGSLITVTGNNFTGSSSGYYGYESVKIKLGTVECPIQSYTPTEIKFTVPKELAIGYHTLSVITPVFTVTSPDQFTLSSPKINSLSPTSAIRGTYVTINGENFGANQYNEATVLVGTTSVSIYSWTETTIKIYITTYMSLGSYKVTVNAGGQSVTSTDNLTITN